MDKHVLIEGYQPIRKVPPKQGSAALAQDIRNGPPSSAPLPKTTSSVQLPRK